MSSPVLLKELATILEEDYQVRLPPEELSNIADNLVNYFKLATPLADQPVVKDRIK